MNDRTISWLKFIVGSVVAAASGVAVAQQEIAFEGVSLGMPRDAAVKVIAGTTCYVHSDGRRIDAEICELPPPGQEAALFAGTTAKRAFHVSEGRVSALSALMSEADARKMADLLTGRLGRFVPYESPRAKRAGKQGVALIWDTPTQRVAFDLHPTETNEFLLMVSPTR